MPWTVYLARCRDGSFYTGITTDPARRVAEHNAGSGAAYTRSRRPVTLVYCELAADRSSALRRERLVRKLSRIEKERLATGGPAEWPDRPTPSVSVTSADPPPEEPS
jgi:putative endonuclease